MTHERRTGVEAAAIGSHCTFEPKSRVPASIALSDSCTVGAGCTLLPSASLADFDVDEHAGDTVASEIETLPERTVVYGAECARRLWSGEGGGQARALHAKHLAYLREVRWRARLQRTATDSLTDAAQVRQVRPASGLIGSLASVRMQTQGFCSWYGDRQGRLIWNSAIEHRHTSPSLAYAGCALVLADAFLV